MYICDWKISGYEHQNFVSEFIYMSPCRIPASTLSFSVSLNKQSGYLRTNRAEKGWKSDIRK